MMKTVYRTNKSYSVCRPGLSLAQQQVQRIDKVFQRSYMGRHEVWTYKGCVVYTVIYGVRTHDQDPGVETENDDDGGHRHKRPHDLNGLQTIAL